MPVYIGADSPAASLAPDLLAARIKVHFVTTADYGKACVGFVDDVVAGVVTHDGEQRLADAVAGGRRRDIGKAGSWGWSRARPDVDISGLVAATLAVFGAKSAPRKPENVEPRRAVLL